MGNIIRVFGYHRTSTKEQHLDRGITEIGKFCKENHLSLEEIYTDQQTGKNFARPNYQKMKETMERILKDSEKMIDDKVIIYLIVSEIDRLGRNKRDTLKEIQWMKDSGIRLIILEIPTTCKISYDDDKKTNNLMIELISNIMIELYTTFAQAEIEKKEKRQREGIEAKRNRGEWDDYGRPRIQYPKNWATVYNDWRAGKIKAVTAMKWLNMKKTSFYKLAKEYEEKLK